MTHERVRDVMTAKVIAVQQRTPYKQIAVMLRESRVGAFPVLDDDGEVIGVVSATDLLAKEAFAAVEDPRLSRPPIRLRARPHARERAKANGLTAGDLMTAPAVTIGPDDTVRHAAQLMSDRRVKRLPVVGPDGRLAGIISRSDVLAVFRRPDGDIQREILRDLITDGFFMDPACFHVTVRDGIVTLESSPDVAVVARIIAEQARHLEGVVAVRERLTEPGAPGAGAPGLSRELQA